MDENIKDACFTLKLNHEFPEKVIPFFKPRLKQILDLIGIAYR